jgi:hypothetical protein
MAPTKSRRQARGVFDWAQMDSQTMCLASSPMPGPAGRRDDADRDGARRFMAQMKQSVDEVEELKGAGILLEIEGATPLLLRESEHKSGLATYVRVEAALSSVAQKSWWDQWSGVVLNCGATAAGAVATAVSCGATPFTAGAAAPVCVASWVGTTATGAQCGLAVAKETSPEFAEYIKSDDGEWINYADLALDVISLGVGVASLPGALKSGSKLLKTSKYTKYLKNADKGKLTKVMAKMEGDLGNLTKYLDKGMKGVKGANPAAKTALTNNIIKRMLPHVTKQLKRDQLEFLSSSISFALTSAASNQGGVGSKGWGVLKLVRIGVYQIFEDE